MLTIRIRNLSFILALFMLLFTSPMLAMASNGIDYSTLSEAELLEAYEALTNQLEHLGYSFEMSKVGHEDVNNSFVASEEASNVDNELVPSSETNTQDELYSKALALEANGNYGEALIKFAALGDYKDAQERTFANVALHAQELFELEDYKACQQLLLQYPSESTKELLSKCNDQAFLLDLADALSDRWSIAGKDETLMSEKKFVEYRTSVVNSELDHIGKYSELEFFDSQLGEYAQSYLGALQSQLTGITEYWGIDNQAYAEYWTEYGYKKRMIAIYWLNQKYGIEFASKYTDDYKTAVMDGLYHDEINSIRNMLEKQLYNIDYTMKKVSDHSAELAPFKISNTSRYTIESISIKAKFLDSSGGNVSTNYLYSNYNGVKPESTMSTNREQIFMNFFDSVVFEYEFRVSDSRYSDTITGIIKPQVQYKWDGRVSKDGLVVGGQEVLELENSITGWETRHGLFVPYLKFSVKNAGTADADRVIAKAVFINNETKEIWDTDTSYIIGSSDAPLKPSYSKKVFSYAGVGFKSKPASNLLPDLVVEVYINDVLILTKTVQR